MIEGWVLSLVLACSLALLLIAGGDLRYPGRRGFYRFLAFESVLLLILLNLPSWITEPFTALHMLSWTLLLCSLLLVTSGFRQLRQAGKPVKGIETTTRLVTSGVYRWIRHPLYASLLYLGWGAFLKDPGGLTIFLVMMCTFSLFMVARKEEVENLARFGEPYSDYMRRTSRFIPFIF
jgi:protein-S-isoprenylcysteine O-methyltransferase Ste14